MKITFIKNVLPCLASGWSEYKAGVKADLTYGAQLVADGLAREGWEPIPASKPEPVKAAPKPVPVKIEPPPKVKPRKRKATPRKTTK